MFQVTVVRHILFRRKSGKMEFRLTELLLSASETNKMVDEIQWIKRHKESTESGGVAHWIPFLGLNYFVLLVQNCDECLHSQPRGRHVSHYTIQLQKVMEKWWDFLQAVWNVELTVVAFRIQKYSTDNFSTTLFDAELTGILDTDGYLN